MKRYFSSIKQYSWIILVCVVLASIVGFLLSRTQPTVYQVSSTLLVSSGAPGTTYPGGPAGGGTSADSLGQALNYSAQIPTRPVMQYIIKYEPKLKARGFTADDLILDVVPTTGTTAATISVLATATHSADAVLIANSVASGFSDYIRSQSQKHLDDLRANFQNQVNALNQQKSGWEAKIASLPNTTDPRYAIYNNNLADTTRNLDTAQNSLNALPTTVSSDVGVIQPAAPKDVTTSAKGLIIIGVTAGVGLLVGILIMLLVIFLDNRLRNDEQINERLGMSYLGSVSNNTELQQSPTRATGVVARELSDICANLRLTGVLPGQWQAPQGSVLLVTSPQSAEGKSTVAAALAATIAHAGATVVVVDGNLQQPSTHLAFGMKPSGFGLSGLLKGTGNESIDDAVIRSTTPGVWLLPAGAAMDSTSLLLQQKLPIILQQLSRKTDIVIIDGPALLSSADASQLANMADGVALVVDSRHDKLPLMLRAKNLLNSLSHTPSGVIMNRLAARSKNRYYATAYNGNTGLEQWTPTNGHAHNGFDNNNGKSSEPEIIRTSSPFPGSLPANSPSAPQMPNRSASTVVPPNMPNNVAMMQFNQQPLTSAPNRMNLTTPQSLRPGKGE